MEGKEVRKCRIRDLYPEAYNGEQVQHEERKRRSRMTLAGGQGLAIYRSSGHCPPAELKWIHNEVEPELPMIPHLKDISH